MNKKQNNKPRLKISLKLIQKDGKVKSFHSDKIRRIKSIIKANNFQKAYLKVNYGKNISHDGNILSFYNDGWYENHHDTQQALKAFIDI